VTAFQAAYGAKFGKAVAKITDDVEELLAFFDYPAEHWVHLRTTNPIESTRRGRTDPRPRRRCGARTASVDGSARLVPQSRCSARHPSQQVPADGDCPAPMPSDRSRPDVWACLQAKRSIA
jgi:hypothetical protein